MKMKGRITCVDDLTPHNELWCEVDGTSGRYMVSSHGRVISYAKVPRGRYIGSINGHGYRVAAVRGFGRPGPIGVHVLVAAHFICRKPAPDLVVDHVDGNRLNNHVSNLRWVTQASNRLFSSMSGTCKPKYLRGLCPGDAAIAYAALGSGMSINDVSEVLGMHRDAVRSIKAGAASAPSAAKRTVNSYLTIFGQTCGGYIASLAKSVGVATVLAVFSGCGGGKPPSGTYTDGVAYVPCQAIDNLEAEEAVELDGGCDE